MTHSLCDIPEQPETQTETNKDTPAVTVNAAAANSQTLMERLKSLNRMVLLAIAMVGFVVVVMMVTATIMFLNK